MNIKIINYGYKKAPCRQHYNDCGADVYSPVTCTIRPGQTRVIPLGFGLEIPDGLAGYIFPRSSTAARGIFCQVPPIDSGYRGEIHAIIYNSNNKVLLISEGDRVGQLVISPFITAEFVTELGAFRGVGGLGSTG